MGIVKTVLLLVSYGTYALSLLLLAIATLVRDDHVADGREVWQLVVEGAGNAKEGRIPAMVKSPPSWLRVPGWAARMLAAENLKAGSQYPCTGGELFVWALLKGKLYFLLAVFFASLGAGLVAVSNDHVWALFGSLAVAAVAIVLGVRELVQFRSELADAAKLRLGRMLNILPYTIDFLVLVLDAGGDFPGALASYLAHGPKGPMRQELHTVLQEIRAGATRVEALQRFAERNPLSEIERLVLVIAQGERMGTPIVEVLREQAELLRLERGQRATQIAEQMAVDSRIWVVGMAFAIMLVLIGPFLLSMMSGIGRVLK